MIKVNLYEENDKLVGFLAKGHAGYAENDADDIICSAVTSLAGTLVTAVTDILEVDVDYDFKSGKLWCNIYAPADKQDEVNLLLRTFEIGCKQIEYSYGSEYVSVIEPIEIK